MKKNLIDSSLPASRIVGTAMCPVCALKGHDGDSCRANLGNDRRVSCVTCARISNPVPAEAGMLFGQPEVVKTAVADLISSNKVDSEAFRVTSVNSGSGHGACLAGHGPDDIMTTVILVRGDHGFEKIEISYTGHDVKAADNPEKLGRDLPESDGAIPDGIGLAAAKLIALGFRIVNVNLEPSLKSLTLIKGRRIVRTSTILGVRASLSWIDDGGFVAPYLAD